MKITYPTITMFLGRRMVLAGAVLILLLMTYITTIFHGERDPMKVKQNVDKEYAQLDFFSKPITTLLAQGQETSSVLEEIENDKDKGFEAETRLTTVENDFPPLMNYLSDGQVMKHRYESVRRCKAEHLGCFVLNGLKRVPVYNGQEFTINTCQYYCFSRNTPYAGITGNGKCYCAHGFADFAATSQCTAVCSSDRTKSCTSPDAVMVYLKTEQCVRGVTKNWIESSKVGCLQLPEYKKSNMVTLLSQNMTIEQCVLNCEAEHYTFAVPIEKYSACLCSDSTSLFKTPENMRETMKACLEGPLPTDDHFYVYRTWAEDIHCTPKRFLPRGSSMALLTSFPGSGNTWMRHLIEVATGIYSGSVYTDKKLYEGGFIGELERFDSGRTIVVKDHLFKFNVREQYKSAILLIRNVYNATLADFARMQTKDHTGAISGDIYRSQKFKKFASGRPKFWIGSARKVLETFSSVMVVYFEDLLEDPIPQLRRIISFFPGALLDPSTMENRLMCMNLDLKGNFKRKKKGLDFDPFDDELRTLYDTTIREMDTLMRKYNHSGLPVSYFNQV